MIMITYHNKNDTVSYFFLLVKKTTNINNISIFPSNMNNTYKVKSYEQKKSPLSDLNR